MTLENNFLNIEIPKSFKTKKTQNAKNKLKMTCFMTSFSRQTTCHKTSTSLVPAHVPQRANDTTSEPHKDFWFGQNLQENYNTPVEHTPGNTPSPLWKESLYSLLVKV